MRLCVGVHVHTCASADVYINLFKLKPPLSCFLHSEIEMCLTVLKMYLLSIWYSCWPAKIKYETWTN